MKKTLKTLEETIQDEKDISFEMIFSVINVSKEIRNLSSRLDTDVATSPGKQDENENAFMAQVREMICENIYLAEMSLRYALSIQELKKSLYLLENELAEYKKK